MTSIAPLRRSALHRTQAEAGARFVDVHGWRVAEAFTTAADEAGRAQRGVGLADTSACGKLCVRGAAAGGVLAKLAGREAPPAARAAIRVRIDGAPTVVCRQAPDELLMLTGPADAAAVELLLARAAEAAGCAHVTDLTSALAALDLVGPTAPRLLARLSPLDLRPAVLPPLGAVQGAVAHVHAVVLRLDGSELPAFRLLVGREHGEFVWTELCRAGQDLGLVLIGAAAHRLLVAG